MTCRHLRDQTPVMSIEANSSVRSSEHTRVANDDILEEIPANMEDMGSASELRSCSEETRGTCWHEWLNSRVAHGPELLSGCKLDAARVASSSRSFSDSSLFRITPAWRTIGGGIYRVCEHKCTRIVPGLSQAFVWKHLCDFRYFVSDSDSREARLVIVVGKPDHDSHF